MFAGTTDSAKAVGASTRETETGAGRIVLGLAMIVAVRVVGRRVARVVGRGSSIRGLPRTWMRVVRAQLRRHCWSAAR
jgi:hypothetical protein